MKKTCRQFTSNGFTLIELLLTIAIVGVLSALVMVSIGQGPEKARDTRRKSDLNQYKLALENYYNSKGYYYTQTGDPIPNANSALCTELSNNNFMPSPAPCLADPKENTTYYYRYLTNTAPSTAYILWAQLEVKNAGYVYYCSNGKNGTKAVESAPTSADCGF